MYVPLPVEHFRLDLECQGIRNVVHFYRSSYYVQYSVLTVLYPLEERAYYIHD
jgi:hypothetical protein